LVLAVTVVFDPALAPGLHPASQYGIGTM
jgi:hypothetical protein